MKIIIVDENDNQIGIKDRKDVLEQDIYRVSGLWVVNSKGEILLAQRAFNKSYDPGKWGPAVAGTVEEGETYDSNIIKEAEEELGLKDIKPDRGPKTRKVGKHNYFAQWYFLSLDMDIDEFKFRTEEVAALRWINKEKLLEEFTSHPEEYLSGVIKWLDLFPSK